MTSAGKFQIETVQMSKLRGKFWIEIPQGKNPQLLYVANINISYILCALDISVRPMIELLLLLHQTLLLDFDYCDSP